ncbi:MAG: hypothetical protein JWL73_248 [Actinomycetia bacterium]|nr:hypothetical protein [Actinomycetes bacterium]
MAEITDEYMREMLGRSRAYCVLLLKGTAKLQEPDAMSIVWEHGRRNFALRADGRLPIVCRVTDDSGWAGVGIFTGTVDEVTAIMDEDPGVKAGLFTYEVLPVSSFPGSCLPD